MKRHFVDNFVLLHEEKLYLFSEAKYPSLSFYCWSKCKSLLIASQTFSLHPQRKHFEPDVRELLIYQHLSKPSNESGKGMKAMEIKQSKVFRFKTLLRIHFFPDTFRPFLDAQKTRATIISKSEIFKRKKFRQKMSKL